MSKKLVMIAPVIIVAAIVAFGAFTLIAKAQTAQSPAIIGSVDSVEAGLSHPDKTSYFADYAYINGWALSQKAPNQPLTILITLDDEYNLLDEIGGATLETDRFRGDITEMYSLDASATAGFWWQIPSKFYDNQERTFYVWAQYSDETPTYIGSSHMEAMDGGVHGALDATTNTRYLNPTLGGIGVIGWAADYDVTSLENPSVAVVAYINDYHAGSSVANLERTDVQNELGVWTNKLGYNFDVQYPGHMQYVDGNVLRIYAVSPTEMELIPIAAASSYITPDGSMSWQYWNSLILE